MNWSDFFAMGGYALYVWGSYAVAAIVLIGNILVARSRASRTRERLEEFYRLKGQSE
ncbi:MAG: heme exporter protein CcmD [Pseudomonadota bacterium]|nr:MAG: heme exporter protein CcmD [Pseudomonadota bacterium]